MSEPKYKIVKATVELKVYDEPMLHSNGTSRIKATFMNANTRVREIIENGARRMQYRTSVTAQLEDGTQLWLPTTGQHIFAPRVQAGVQEVKQETAL